MNSFSISQLEQFSGIKAHTIRIWEQRYNALQPDRSEGNTRSYNGAQLRRLLNIASLIESGHKVSELCVMGNTELFALMEKANQDKIEPQDDTTQYYLTQLIAAGMSFNEGYFDKIFANCVLRFGLNQAYVQVIYPLLVRMGLLWSANTLTPAYEHFISNLLKQKLYAAIDALPPANASKGRWLLFLPTNEFHEIGLLFSQYLIRQSGYEVIYLGADIPLEVLTETAEELNPTHLLFFFVHQLPEAIAIQYVDKLKSIYPKSTILIGSNEQLLSKIPTTKHIHKMKGVDDLVKQL
jgi:MerR family transcriptional regulator, light-induced transcriptional regulator